MSIKRIIIISIFLIVAAIRFLYLDNQIASNNLEYYQGKDNGVFVQFESIIIFGVLFYFAVCEKNRILNAILGLLISFIISIVVYIMIGDGISFPVISCSSIVIFFFIIEFLSNKINSGN